MIASTAEYKVTWEKLPEDFVLPNDPVDNINHTNAAALTDSLVNAGIPTNALTPTNYAICATVNGIVVKAPDWAYVKAIRVPREDVKRSYTPQLQGEMPVIVMEFISDIESEVEYSTKPTYPPGKWFFYERILKVPNYAIFEPDLGTLEVYRLGDQRRYEIQAPDENNRYWIDEMKLFLGVWHGSRENRTGFWLRWWNEQQDLLLWSSEVAQQERQRAERLAAQLRAAGIEPEA